MEASPNTDRPVSLLIVDDDAVTREVISLMLSRRFPEITFYLADQGAKGVELFKKHTPEIVITDIQMPEMDGFEMAAVIKEIRAETKFIVLTAYSSSINLKKFNTIGGLSFLSKPIEFDKLFAAIETCISGIIEEQN